MNDKALVKQEESKEIIDIKPEENKDVVAIKNFHYAQLKITDKERLKLFAPIDEDDIEIRPDGLIYAPWMEYMTRLRDVFGLEWALIPIDKPMSKNNTVIWGFQLVIKGNIMGVAYGEQVYYPGGTMNWTDALEGAKSNALMRCCKGMGISIELWKPSFYKAWKIKYAESYKYFNPKKNKEEIRWKRKGSKTPVDNTPDEETKTSNKTFPPKSNNSAKNKSGTYLTLIAQIKDLFSKAQLDPIEFTKNKNWEEELDWKEAKKIKEELISEINGNLRQSQGDMDSE